MSIGTIFTLFVVPAIYVLFARDHARQRAAEKIVEAGTAALSEPQPAGK